LGAGTWSSSSPAIGSIDATTGIVTGISAGTTTINYSLFCGSITAIVTVNPLPATPAAIGGTFFTCEGSTTSLSESVSGGTWTSGNGAIAVVGTSGIVNGISSGNTNITYTISNGCGTNFVYVPVTINPLPSVISGSTTVCTGTTTALSSSAGVTWSSSNTSVAIVNSGTGIVTGVSTGTVTITCVLSTGCFRTTTLTVNTSPSSISGTPSTCAGSTSTLSDAGGGTWTSSNANATIGSSSGIVTGVSAGTSTITYTLPNGCISTVLFTVNALSAGTT
jgi:uncharacterized protein YjdB